MFPVVGPDAEDKTLVFASTRECVIYSRVFQPVILLSQCFNTVLFYQAVTSFDSKLPVLFLRNVMHCTVYSHIDKRVLVAFSSRYSGDVKKKAVRFSKTLTPLN